MRESVPIVGLSPFFQPAVKPHDEESVAYIRNVVFASSRARRRALLAARFYVQQTRKLIAMATKRGAASDVAEDVFTLLVAARDEHETAHEAGERMRIYKEAL